MRYTNNLSETDKLNNLKKAVAAENSVLRLVNNFGTARLVEISRLFCPQNKEWEARVSALTLAHLSFMYAKVPHIAKQFKPNVSTLAVLGSNAGITKSTQKKLSRKGKFSLLTKSELRTFVDIFTGWRASKVEADSLYVLKIHWLLARAVAVETVNNSGIVLALRVIKRLIETEHLRVSRTSDGGLVYSLTPWGHKYLNDEKPQSSRTRKLSSGIQSAHKTLANGYLLHALCEATDAWSEGSMFKDPADNGVLGTPGLLTHEDLAPEVQGASKGANKRGPHGVHPADGAVFHRLSQTAAEETWGVDLVEAERGSKASDTFLKSLALIQHIGNDISDIVRFKKDNSGKMIRQVFKRKKLVYVMNSEEFLSPILRACRQFVTKTAPNSSGVWVPTPGIVFEGRFGWSTENFQERFEELLGHIQVAFCPLGVSGQTFLGVTLTRSLWEIASEQGVLDYRKVVK